MNTNELDTSSGTGSTGTGEELNIEKETAKCLEILFNMEKYN